MKNGILMAAALAVAGLASTGFGAIYTVDSTGILNPNPSNLTTNEVGNTSLAAARTLISAAKTAGTGGVVDFQQRNQGGTFPNSTAVDNGQDFGNGALNPLYVTNGATGDGLVGTPMFSFYRLESTGTTGVNGVNNFDSNLNQGANVISGGFSSRYPGAVSASNPSGDGTSVTGVNSNYVFRDANGVPLATQPTLGGGYMGVTNLGSPATMVFNNPLSFFGITAIPRGADRTTTLTATLSDSSTVVIGTGVQTTAAGTQGQAVFFGYTAPAGLSINRVAITADGFVRFDDLAFAVVPEPASLGLLSLGGLAMLRRRRA